MAIAHASLDELGVPRSTDTGKRLTLFGRIEALRSGQFDPTRLSHPAPPLGAAEDRAWLPGQNG